MTVTGTDLFAGAGGSTTGAFQVPGVHITIAANHNQVVTDIHALNHQQTDHAVVDLHEERPSFFPTTDFLWASPECTKWSQANGQQMPAIEEGLFEDPFSDEAKNRSRLLMFDVLKFIEYHRYKLVVVENVVDIATQAKYRTAWTVWRQELRVLGYNFRVMSVNSMHAQVFGLPAPQSRDRIYIVAWPETEKAPDLERIVRPPAYCGSCDAMVEATQSWKPRREVGRYRQAYIYCCSRCGSVVDPFYLPALTAIDWSIPGTPIGDRLADKTRLRIAHGIAKWWGPVTLEAAGNTFDSNDPKHRNYGELDGYQRAWPVEEELRALHTTNSKGIAVPEPLLSELYGTALSGRPVSDPAGTFTSGGNHHGLIQSYYGTARDARGSEDPIPTITTVDRHALITRHHGIEGGQASRHTTPSEEYMRTVTTTGGNMSLVHRMNGDGAAMTTPPYEQLRTLTAGGTQAILTRPAAREITPASLAAAMEMLPEVRFRMFQPHEVAAGMAFPADYQWQPPDRNKPVSKGEIVAAAGNAVCPPNSRDTLGVALEEMGMVA